uniref:Uncharacterized protein n=1 Tax=Arundo donax TaxID=35708 RepID=A0A0A8YTM7_ARUDO
MKPETEEKNKYYWPFNLQAVHTICCFHSNNHPNIYVSASTLLNAARKYKEHHEQEVPCSYTMQVRSGMATTANKLKN